MLFESDDGSGQRQRQQKQSGVVPSSGDYDAAGDVADQSFGGVDFSHVQMKSVPHKKCDPGDKKCKAVKPLFSVVIEERVGAKDAATGRGRRGGGGDKCVAPKVVAGDPMASALSPAYCIFKTLPQDAFWVNLNPSKSE